jgi:hypothetical protein
MIGTWWLKTLESETQKLEGLKFIEEGIANNPDSFALQTTRGYLLRELKRDAIATESFLKAAELVFNERPAGGEISRDWTMSREEMAVGAWTMAVLLVRDRDGNQAALDLARKLHERSQAEPVGRLVTVLEQAMAQQGSGSSGVPAVGVPAEAPAPASVPGANSPATAPVPETATTTAPATSTE